MRRPLAALVGANALVGIAIVATYGSGLGDPWQENAAYLGLAAAALALLPHWRRRRFTTLVLASSGAWSMITGVLLVDVTWRLPGGRWMVFWHAATSAAFVIAFLFHWARNEPRLLGLFEKLRPMQVRALALAWGAIVLAAAASFFARVTEQAALDVANASLAGALVLAVGAISAGRARRRRAAASHTRGRIRGAIDASLLVSMWLAIVTGVALQYAGRTLRAADADWWMYAWHVGVSAILLGLALGHAAFNARPLAAHARGPRPRA